MRWRSNEGGWNPYLAGALVGLLAVASAYIATILLGKTSYLGASTTFVRAVGLLEQLFAPEHVAGNAYFIKTKVRIDWQFMLVIGICIGAFISSLTDRSFKLESIPRLWEERFGPSIIKRFFGAFFGGMLAMMGVRMASGCPSGHGLSGMMQLSVSGLAALTVFFLCGIVVANIIYRRR